MNDAAHQVILLTFRPSNPAPACTETPGHPWRRGRSHSTKCAFGKELRAVILHSHFAQLRGHWAKQGLAPMNEQVIEAMAASNSLRAPLR